MYRDYVDMSVAVATPKGLVTPVVRNAEAMGFIDIEKEIDDCLRQCVALFFVYQISDITSYLPNAPFRRMEESEIHHRTLGVSFENLSVTGLGTSASVQPTLGSALNPFNALSAIRNARHPPLKEILTDFEGVVRPGEMLRAYFL